MNASQLGITAVLVPTSFDEIYPGSSSVLWFRREAERTDARRLTEVRPTVDSLALIFQCFSFKQISRFALTHRTDVARGGHHAR